jgi:formylglycine-generating enzyme
MNRNTKIFVAIPAVAIVVGVAWYTGQSNMKGSDQNVGLATSALGLDGGLCEPYNGIPEATEGSIPGMAWVDGGSFQMGSEVHYADETPVREMAINGFWIDTHEVTNAQFSEFIQATGYVTTAERAPNPALHPGIPVESLVAGGVVFQADMVGSEGFNNRWAFVPGANWRSPEGPGSDIMDRANHPVVQVTIEDAEAYAQWRGNSLPSEAEWEYAARGGLQGRAYVWGDEFEPDGKQMANTWQGLFPFVNQETDGFAGTSPVGCYLANGYHLYDMVGNVWELTADEYDASTNTQVMKGGSYLCAPSYCRRYRPSARHPQEKDLSTGHVSFRTIRRSS